MGELVRIDNYGMFVAMAMTDAAFDSAQKHGARGMDANLEAMATVAHDIRFSKDADPATLPPLFFIAREAGPVRSAIGGWDHRVPAHTGDPQTSRYFSVTELGQDNPNTLNREQLVRIARAMGATAFYELSIHDWNGPFVEAYAKALLTGKRPLDLPKPPNPLLRLGKALIAPLPTDTRKMHRIHSARDRKPPLPDPFTIWRGEDQTA